MNSNTSKRMSISIGDKLWELEELRTERKDVKEIGDMLCQKIINEYNHTLKTIQEEFESEKTKIEQTSIKPGTDELVATHQHHFGEGVILIISGDGWKWNRKS